MDAAWEAGITTFDTADAYGGGRSESFIGSWLRTKGADVRDRIVLTTKTFNPMSDGADHGLSPDADPAPARQQPGPARRRVDPALPRACDGSGRAGGRDDRRVRRARRRGEDPRVRRQQRRRRLARGGAAPRAGPDWVQNSYSLLDREADEGVLEVCAREGLGFTPVQPARRRLAHRQVPARRGAAGGLADDAPARAVPAPAGPIGSSTPSRRSRRRRPSAGRRPPTLAFAWLLGHPHVTAIVVGPRRPDAAPSRARRARARALAARARPADAGSSHERAHPVGARRTRAAADGRVHRGDGRGPALARTRRAAPAAPVRHAPAGRRHADGLHARAPQRAELRLVAEGDRDRPREPDARARRAPGRRAAARRRDGRAARAPERLADHRDPHGCGLGGRDPGAGAHRSARRRDPRRRRPGPLARRGDAHGPRRRRDPHAGAAATAARPRQVLRGADIVCTCTSAREPILQRELAGAGDTRERRRLEHPDSPRARHGDDGRGQPLRRPPRVDAERVRRPAARRGSARSTSAPRSARC